MTSAERERRLREQEKAEEERAVEIARSEESTYEHEDNRLRGVLLLFGSLWRLIRGEDQRGRKVRWLLSLLRPYRRQVALMFVALVVATARPSPRRRWWGWPRPRSARRARRSESSR